MYIFTNLVTHTFLNVYAWTHTYKQRTWGWKALLFDASADVERFAVCCNGYQHITNTVKREEGYILHINTLFYEYSVSYHAYSVDLKRVECSIIHLHHVFFFFTVGQHALDLYPYLTGWAAMVISTSSLGGMMVLRHTGACTSVAVSFKNKEAYTFFSKASSECFMDVYRTTMDVFTEFLLNA